MNNQRQQDKQDQQIVWDALAEKWHAFRQKPLPVAEKFSKEWKPGKIIDIGCGNCRNLVSFAKQGFDCYGIDFSKKMIEIAKSYLKQQKLKAKIISEKAEKIPYKDNHFDYCLMMRTLPCIQSEEARNNALNEMKRILKKGGEAIITIWNKRNFKFLLSKKEAMVPWRIKLKTGKEKVFMRYYYMYTPSEIQKLLVSKGFVILDSSNPFKEDYYVIVQKS